MDFTWDQHSPGRILWEQGAIKKELLWVWDSARGWRVGQPVRPHKILHVLLSDYSRLR